MPKKKLTLVKTLETTETPETPDQTSFQVIVSQAVIHTYTLEDCWSVEDAYDRATKLAKKKGGIVV